MRLRVHTIIRAQAVRAPQVDGLVLQFQDAAGARFDCGVIEATLTLLRASAKLQNKISEDMARYGLSMPRFDVLMLLKHAPAQRLALSEIGEHLRVSPANVTKLVDALERDALVARTPHQSDRRITLAELTDHGLGVLEEFIPRHCELLTSVWQDFPPPLRGEFVQFMNRLIASLERAGRQ